MERKGPRKWNARTKHLECENPDRGREDKQQWNVKAHTPSLTKRRVGNLNHTKSNRAQDSKVQRNVPNDTRARTILNRLEDTPGKQTLLSTQPSDLQAERQ